MKQIGRQSYLFDFEVIPETLKTIKLYRTQKNTQNVNTLINKKPFKSLVMKKTGKANKENIIQNKFQKSKKIESNNNRAVQTQEYKELLEYEIYHQNVEIQTDPLLSKPLVKHENLFQQQNVVSVATQIDQQLFDFNKQVDTVIRVLLNKILEESRFELLEEIELQNMNRQKREFQQKKMLLMNQTMILKNKEKKIEQEMQRSSQQAKHHLSYKKIIHQKLISRQFSKNLLYSSLNSAFNFLEEREKFFEKNLTPLFLEIQPAIFQQTQNFIEQKKYYNFIFNELIDNSREDSLTQHESAIYYHKKKILENQIEQKKEKQKRQELRRKQKEKLILAKLKKIEIENAFKDIPQIKFYQKNFIIVDQPVNTEKHQVAIEGGFLKFLWLIVQIIEEELDEEEIDLNKIIKHILMLLDENMIQFTIPINVDVMSFIFIPHPAIKDYSLQNLAQIIAVHGQSNKKKDQQIVENIIENILFKMLIICSDFGDSSNQQLLKQFLDEFIRGLILYEIEKGQKFILFQKAINQGPLDMVILMQWNEVEISQSTNRSISQLQKMNSKNVNEHIGLEIFGDDQTHPLKLIYQFTFVQKFLQKILYLKVLKLTPERIIFHTEKIFQDFKKQIEKNCIDIGTKIIEYTHSANQS